MNGTRVVVGLAGEGEEVTAGKRGMRGVELKGQGALDIKLMQISFGYLG